MSHLALPRRRLSIPTLVPTAHRLPLSLAVLIFTLYFASAVGLANSGDTPQYFTTEALLQHGNVDISPFSTDPHYFIGDDYALRNEQVFGVRGYLLSLFTAPLHLVSHLLKGFYNVQRFPGEVRYARDPVRILRDEHGLPVYLPVGEPLPNFAYELSITALFTAFSVAGLLIFWRIAADLTHNNGVATIVTILLGIGSYIWKYSAYYTRHGLTVLLLSITIYCVWRWTNQPRARPWMVLFCICWSVSFGIDVILFMALTMYMCGYAMYLGTRSLVNHAGDEQRLLKYLLLGLLLASPILVSNIALNYYWYGTFWFAQTGNMPIIRAALGDMGNEAWMSTPLYPTIVVVLFGASRIPPEVFSGADKLPEAVRVYGSIEYAKRYAFLGLFSISPFVLLGLTMMAQSWGRKEHRGVLSYCIVVFTLGIVGNTKLFVFWGGNQYDVRYFYPYVVLLGIPTVLALNEIVASRDRWRVPILGMFGMSALFAVCEGWIGVLNMYKPAVTGERRLIAGTYSTGEGLVLLRPIDIVNAWEVLPRYGADRVLDATVLNRDNAWIAVTVVLAAYGVWRVASYIAKVWKDRASRKEVSRRTDYLPVLSKESSKSGEANR